MHCNIGGQSIDVYSKGARGQVRVIGLDSL